MLSRTVTCPVHVVVDGEAQLGGEARVVFGAEDRPFNGEAKRFVTFETGAMSMRFTYEDLREILRESNHVAGVQNGA